MTILRHLALAAALTALLSPFAAAADAAPEPAPARLIVRYATPSGATAARHAARAEAETARLAAAIGQPLRRLRTLASGAELIDAGAALDAAALEALAAQVRQSAGARVIAVEPDRLLQATLTPNDPSLASQWGLAGPTQGNSVAGVNAYPAWDRSDGSGAVVAVIDTGYRPHADLAAQVVAQYDFISDTTSANDGGGRDSNAQDPGDYRDGVVCGGAPAASSSWHGTHVAGTVAALTNNGVGVAGVAYGAKLVIARVLGRCGGYTSDISDAIIWSSGGSVAGIAANPYPANVINMSLGGQYPCSASPEMQNAINSARSRNTTVVVAAGNSSADAGGFTPASCSGVITVAAVGRTGGRAYYSNYGSVVDVAGPGGDASQGTAAQILSTYNTGTTTPGSDTYAYLQGTSMATPHVAGVVALMLGLQPALTPDEVETALKSSTRAFPATCSSCGTGIVDADQALASLAPGAGRLAFSATAYTVAENGGGATISVQRGGGSAGAVSVNYATANGTAAAGSDYTAANGTLSWADGDTAAKTFTVPIVNDTAAESAETIALTLSSPSGGATLGTPKTATLTITDDDSARGVLGFAASAYTVAENGGSVVVTVSRTAGAYGAASVSYTTANSSALAGSDFVASTGTLTWASGDTANKTIRISVLDDIAAEPTETFQVRLSNAIGATLGTTTTTAVSITDNDTLNPAGIIVFSSTAYAVNEGGGSATITVRRTGGNVGAVTINYATANGTALAGSDYTAASGTLSWGAGDASNKTFTIPITDDASAESSETVLLALSSPGGGATLGSTRNATLTIADNDSSPGVLSLASTSYSVSEGGGTVKVSVARTGGSTGAVAINYATANSSALSGNDYIAASGTLRWASGDATPKTVSITVLNDALVESNESFQLRLSAPVTAPLSGQSYATITIVDDDTVNPAGIISFSSATYAVNEGGGGAVITVRRTGGSVGAVSVNYATANGLALAGGDYTAASGTLTWAAGDTSNKTFTIPITDDASAESSETVLLSLSSPGGGATLGSAAAATLTIADNDSSPGVLSLASTSYSVSEGGGSIKISVARTGGASGAVTINYATANSSALSGNDYIAASGTLRWASGDAAPKTVTISILNDAVREGAESFQLRLSSPVTAALSGQSYATIAIIDND